MTAATLERPPLPTTGATGQARPVQLEANRTGLWHLVLEFDAGDKLAEASMRDGVEALCLVDQSVAFRVVTKGPLKQTLLNYSARHGWTLGK